MEEKLNIVDENDEIIGEEARGKIHKEGLLHRETHVWFLTPNKELILQLRAKDKDTFPDMLDATVGGHVDLGMNYEDTALKEMEEETGIKAKMEDLKFLRKIRLKSDDLV
ncbi:MAG: NUDIX domain-containing protein, partial [Patescibacteria group bacterium]